MSPSNTIKLLTALGMIIQKQSAKIEKLENKNNYNNNYNKEK